MRKKGSALSGLVVFAVTALLLTLTLSAQETTGGLQGTVRDQSGGVVPNAQVIVRGASLLGDKQLETDASGYFRFANLPPGDYKITASTQGFRAVERTITLQVGHLPTIDFTLEVGATTEVVRVGGEAPPIDVTSNQNMTNVTEDVLANVPHGLSYQSVIQFARWRATNL